MKKYDVVALGELLIDFTDNGRSSQGNPVFEANPGGAPCNVLAMLRKLGKDVAFIGKVGCDGFGKQLADVLTETGIATEGLKWDEYVHTTLAVVHTLPGGDRDFSFYRNPGADMMLTEEELPLQMLENCRIFHFGTLSMTHEAVRKATLKSIEGAKRNGALISFDPNLRPPLWDDLEDARKAIAWGLAQCDILKIADNALLFMTGEEDFYKGAAILQQKFPNIKILNVTAGADGSYSFYGENTPVFVPSCKLGGVIETTGAGDTFCASVLNFVLENGVAALTEQDREKMLKFANTAAYIVTTRKGAIRAMPEKEEVLKLLK